jgi:hypothetical protein
VDNGHQPWRLNPIDVAYSELALLDNKLVYASCRLLDAKKREATVLCNNAAEKKYTVQMKKLVKFKNGIWTVLKIEWDREK